MNYLLRVMSGADYRRSVQSHPRRLILDWSRPYLGIYPVLDRLNQRLWSNTGNYHALFLPSFFFFFSFPWAGQGQGQGHVGGSGIHHRPNTRFTKCSVLFCGSPQLYCSILFQSNTTTSIKSRSERRNRQTDRQTDHIVQFRSPSRCLTFLNELFHFIAHTRPRKWIWPNFT